MIFGLLEEKNLRSSLDSVRNDRTELTNIEDSILKSDSEDGGDITEEWYLMTRVTGDSLRWYEEEEREGRAGVAGWAVTLPPLRWWPSVSRLQHWSQALVVTRSSPENEHHSKPNLRVGSEPYSIYL